LGSPRCPAVRLQTAPTTPAKATTTAARYGCYEPAFNLPSLVEAAGASYVARWTTFHVRQLARSMTEMLTKRGFGFIEVLSPLPHALLGLRPPEKVL